MTQPHHSMAQFDALQDVAYIQIGQKRHPSADGMVDRAHRGATDRELFIVGSRMQLVAPPCTDNGHTTIVHASVLMYDPNNDETYTFEDIGDANMGNCSSPQTGQAAPRMASTRALSRALAQALNIAGAVAEEIAEGGSGQQAVQQQQNPSGGYQQQPAQGQQGAQQQQNGHVPAIKAQFPNAYDRKFQIPGGQKKGTWIDDPSISVDRDLLYWLGKGFFTKNQQTQAYDIPDPEMTAIWQAEISRRQGLGNQQAAPQQAQQQQNVPNYGQAQQQAPAQQQQNQQYQPPVQQQAQQQQPPAQQQGAWVATAVQMGDLMKLGKASGRQWPQVKQLCQENFGHDNINGLDLDGHNMLRMSLGGDPL